MPAFEEVLARGRARRGHQGACSFDGVCASRSDATGDLNPNNVLLKRDPIEPSGYAIKVGDFGLSVLLPQHRTHLSNVRMGTMFYMCPAVVLKVGGAGAHTHTLCAAAFSLIVQVC